MIVEAHMLGLDTVGMSCDEISEAIRERREIEAEMRAECHHRRLPADGTFEQVCTRLARALGLDAARLDGEEIASAVSGRRQVVAAMRRKCRQRGISPNGTEEQLKTRLAATDGWLAKIVYSFGSGLCEILPISGEEDEVEGAEGVEDGNNSAKSDGSSGRFPIYLPPEADHYAVEMPFDLPLKPPPRIALPRTSRTAPQERGFRSYQANQTQRCGQRATSGTFFVWRRGAHDAIFGIEWDRRLKNVALIITTYDELALLIDGVGPAAGHVRDATYFFNLEGFLGILYEIGVHPDTSSNSVVRRGWELHSSLLRDEAILRALRAEIEHRTTC
jgi:hypothetical protein